MAGTSLYDRENPHISDEEFEQDQSAVIKNLMDRIKELEDKLSIMKDAEVKASTDDHDKLKPIDIKDIERPDKYDNQAANINNWFDKVKDLLTSRNGNWEQLLGMIENRGKVPTKSQKEFINSLDDATCKSIKEQSDTYAQHLKSYLRTHTDGELHAHVTQTDYDEVIGADAGSDLQGSQSEPQSSHRPQSKGPVAATSEQDERTRQDSDGMETHTKNDCGRAEIQDGRRDNANNLAEDHASRIREGHERAAGAREARGRLLQFRAGTSHELIVVLKEGGQAIKVRTVRPKTEGVRWSAIAIKDIVATPDMPNPKDDSQKDPRNERNARGLDLGASERQLLPKQCARDEPGLSRNFRINNRILEKYGPTMGCKGCENKMTGVMRGHTRVSVEQG